MHRSIPPADPTRVLAVVSHSDYPSLAAIDRWGLVPRRGSGRNPNAPSFFQSWDAREWGRHAERAERFFARFRRVLVRVRPALVVLGIPAREGAFARGFRLRLMALLRDLAIRHVVRPVAGAWKLLVERPFRRATKGLAEVLSSAAFPQLDPDRAGRRRRPRWYALALALVELARRHPRQAMALLHRDVPGLSRLIQRQEQRLRPDQV